MQYKFLPIESPGIVCVKLWVNGGSSRDKSNKKGENNLLASLLTRGCGKFNTIEIADIVEDCGAGLRCDTHEDGLVISIKCMQEDVLKLIDLVGWMIKDPHLNEHQISLERNLVLQSIRRQKESPMQIAFDGWRKCVYKNGPYSHDPQGVKEDIKTITRVDLLNVKEQLNRSSKYLVVAGSVPSDLNEHLSKLETYKDIRLYKNIDNRRVESVEDRKIEPQNPNSIISINPMETEQVSIMIGDSTVPHGTHEDLILRLLSNHLGNGMSSILFKELREKKGLAYDVGTYHSPRTNQSPFIIYLSTTEEKSLSSIKLLKEILIRLKHEKISSEELTLAKAKFRGQLLYSSQTINQKAARQAHLMSFGLSEEFDELTLKKIESITSNDIRNSVNKFLNQPILSVCGPIGKINSIAEIWSQS